MQIIDLLSPDRVQVGTVARSKKRLLELISELLSHNESEIGGRCIYNSLCDRERLGSTGLGNGIAIPHGRIEAQDAIGAFIRLRDGIDFQAPDGQPVDLVFAMVVPEHDQEEHLGLLAQLAELFANEGMRDQLRSASSEQAIFDMLDNWQGARAGE